jgi:hypothetical protein
LKTNEKMMISAGQSAFDASEVSSPNSLNPQETSVFAKFFI